MDRYMSEYPLPAFISRTLLSQSPFINDTRVSDYANSSIYQSPSKAWVFAAGTISWSLGLDAYDGGGGGGHPDAGIQRTTQNILDVFVTATHATLVSIAVTPASSGLAKGLNRQFTATGTYSDGSTADLTATSTWASSSTTVATISSTGLAHAVSPGTTTISATLGSVVGSTGLTVSGRGRH
jgi:hypothetical protein